VTTKSSVRAQDYSRGADQQLLIEDNSNHSSGLNSGAVHGAVQA
jgi:hypothetical protein